MSFERITRGTALMAALTLTLTACGAEDEPTEPDVEETEVEEVEDAEGEVSDESDPPEFQSRRDPDGSLLLSGLLRPDEARELGVPAPDAPEYETLGGLAMRAIGAVPAVGDRFDLGGRSARVTQMDGRRVELLRVEPPPENTDE